MKKPVFTLPALVKWLKTQPKTKTFDYLSNGNCMLAQFFKAQGFKDVSVGGEDVDFDGGSFSGNYHLWKKVNDLAEEYVTTEPSYRFTAQQAIDFLK